MLRNLTMNEKRRNLIRGWVALQKNWWSYDAVSKIVHGKNKAAAWKMLQELVQTVPQALLEDVGAGPLEDFVKDNADQYIEKLERCAAQSSRWRRALKHVWFRASETAASERLTALGCTALNMPPRNPTRRSRRRPRLRRFLRAASHPSARGKN